MRISERRGEKQQSGSPGVHRNHCLPLREGAGGLETGGTSSSGSTSGSDAANTPRTSSVLGFDTSECCLYFDPALLMLLSTRSISAVGAACTPNTRSISGFSCYERCSIADSATGFQTTRYLLRFTRNTSDTRSISGFLHCEEQHYWQHVRLSDCAVLRVRTSLRV